MSRKCERCQGEITVSHILGQDSFSEIRCANCGRILEATLISKMLVVCYLIIGIAFIAIISINILFICIIEYIWVIVSYYYLPAFLYFYKEKNEDSLK